MVSVFEETVDLPWPLALDANLARIFRSLSVDRFQTLPNFSRFISANVALSLPVKHLTARREPFGLQSSNESRDSRRRVRNQAPERCVGGHHRKVRPPGARRQAAVARRSVPFELTLDPRVDSVRLRGHHLCRGK